MADINNNDSLINGDTTSEFFDSTDFPPLKSSPSPSAVDVDLLHKTISDLERENSVSESRIAELNAELKKLRVEKDAELEKLRVEKDAVSESSESHGKAAEAIAKRAAELEIEVARLQHDLISAMNDSSESNREIQKLNAEIVALKREKSEVESKVKVMENKMEELMKKSNDSDDLIHGFMQKIEDREIEATLKANDELVADEVRSGDCAGGCDQFMKQLKENAAAIAVVTGGVIVAGGIMCYVRHIRN
ncbi:hypothetical protein RND81_04G182200 [Saponaria officinalis]|uniref:Uncharacterized protein n=1 Tax=Saponaria officinalis TaxID=3572 RepID=A0AAW1LN55_SAPOF